MPEVAPHAVELVSVDEVRPLRLRVLRTGMEPSSVVYPGDDDPATRHYAVRDASGRVIGAITARPEDRMAGQEPILTPGHRVRGIAVDEPFRRNGVGRAILERVLADLAGSPAKELWANVREPAIPFASALGLVAVSEPFEMPGLGSHVVMARPL
jgi:GNAT superfamily N-acetyltransferase